MRLGADLGQRVIPLLEEYYDSVESDPEAWARARIRDREILDGFVEAARANAAEPITWQEGGLPEIAGFTDLQPIGSGGHSLVFRARETELHDRAVAIKIPRSGALSETARSRFEREVRALVLLRHTNVAQVYGTAMAVDGRPCIVMELVEGVSITRHCDAYGLDTRARLELFAQAAAGVAAAQARGILHRDLKPNNLLVVQQIEGAVAKVIDFGVSRLPPGPAAATTGGLKGTLPYMSPEQLDASYGPIGPATDVYSLGLVLYSLVYGQQPFARAELQAYEEQRLARQEVPPIPPDEAVRRPEDSNGSLESLLAAALAPHVHEREATAASLLERTRSAIEEEKAMGPRGGARRRGALLVLAGVVVLLAAVAVWFQGRTEPAVDTVASPPSTSGLHETAEMDQATPAVRSEPDGAEAAPEDTEPAGDAGAGSRGEGPGEAPTARPRRTSWPAGSRAGETKLNPRDGLAYVWVPPGSFLFGCSPGDDECEPDEQPAERKQVARGFWLGESEVTVSAYVRVMSRSRLPPSPSFNAEWGDGDQPVVNVEYSEATRFCTLAATRLPTEVEWEYAARAGEARELPQRLEDAAWYSANSAQRARGVKRRAPNRFGLFDMLGNAAEWVASDPRGATAVLRGGSWRHDESFLRFSFRLIDSHGSRTPMYGFRCGVFASG